MELKEYLPTDSLKPFIKSYRVISCKEGQVNRVLPNTSMALAFRISGQVSFSDHSASVVLPAITLSGLRKSARLIKYNPQTTTIVVLFKQSGARAFFGKGIHALYEQSISLDDWYPKGEVSCLEEQLHAVNDIRNKIAVIERFLLSKLLFPEEDKLVSEVMVRISTLCGIIRIKELAGHFSMSQDALEKRFRKITGTTPKQFCGIVRMNSIIHQCQSVPSFLDMAFENGYYDQSHFIKDFKVFTGQTPTAFFHSARYW